MSKAITF